VVLLQLFHVSWGGQFQSPFFVYGMVMLFTVFGLNMFGLFEVGSSAVGVGSGLMRKSELSGSFFSGLLATVVSTPCSAPFLAPALAYGLALTLVPSLLFFTVIGLGLAAPYLILSLFPSLLKLLPRPGAWMESFKQSMSFLMLGAAAFFAWVLQGLISETSQRDLLIGIVIVAAACWVYGRWCVISKPTKTRLISGLTALALFGGGLAWGWPQPKDSTWQPWSPELVKSLREQGKPVYIDFTARWCASCQVNKRVYKDRALQEDLKAKGITLLKADWTDHDERITEAIAALNKAAVPVNVLYVPGKEEPYVLPELLTVDNVRSALAHVDADK
jgi:thiol:disulfide interchange protein